MTNMLAGAALMDGVILVIAANEPVPMPQTREHLLALQMLGMKKMVVVQNKIDRVDADGARKNYEAIKQFLANTVGADAPIIPVSAQNRINIDALIESIEENIPTPHHDLSASPQMYILRSFDVNRPGADVKSLVGGVLGGSLVSGELSVGDEIEISPGIAEERTGKYTPIITKVASLGTGAGMTEKVGPGGLIALGTALDPRLTKGDVLVGNLVGKPGSLPPMRTHITVDLQLFDQAVGSVRPDQGGQGEGDRDAEAQHRDRLDAGDGHLGARHSGRARPEEARRRRRGRPRRDQQENRREVAPDWLRPRPLSLPRDQTRARKRRAVAFDSSFLVAVMERPTPWSEDISERVGAFTPVVLSSVRDELRRLAAKGDKRGRFAALALELLEEGTLLLGAGREGEARRRDNLLRPSRRGRSRDHRL